VIAHYVTGPGYEIVSCYGEDVIKVATIFDPPESMIRFDLAYDVSLGPSLSDLIVDMKSLKSFYGDVFTVERYSE
jgi:hypothetical protein